MARLPLGWSLFLGFSWVQALPLPLSYAEVLSQRNNAIYGLLSRGEGSNPVVTQFNNGFITFISSLQLHHKRFTEIPVLLVNHNGNARDGRNIRERKACPGESAGNRAPLLHVFQVNSGRISPLPAAL